MWRNHRHLAFFRRNGIFIWRISTKITFRIAGHFVKREYERSKQACNELSHWRHTTKPLFEIWGVTDSESCNSGHRIFAKFSSKIFTVRDFVPLSIFGDLYFLTFLMTWPESFWKTVISIFVQVALYILTLGPVLISQVWSRL